MDPQLIGWLSLAGLFLLLGVGVPVAFVLTGLGLWTYILLAGSGPGFGIIPITFYGKTAIYALTAVPLFLLMGHFAYYAGFGADIYSVARHWVGSLPGGLAQATVVGAAGFGAACGSGLAGCAMLTKIAVPEMLKHGYSKRLAFGCVATAGPIAAMIPPSVMMVLYGIITEQSVARLLIAGVFPGLVCAAMYMLTIFVWARLQPQAVPPPAKMQWNKALASLKKTWGIVLLAITVMGGIYAGIFTPTEAGAIGAFGALVLGLVARRFNRGSLVSALLETARTTSMVYLILAGAYVFGYLLAITRLPFALSEILTTLPVTPHVILTFIMIFYLILGCFMDMVPAMFITLPVILPAIMKLGFNPIWFGVLIVQLGEISMVTPPFGLNLFVMKSLMPDQELREIVLGVIPFVISGMITLGIYIAFPAIALFLPSLMFGG